MTGARNRIKIQKKNKNWVRGLERGALLEMIESFAGCVSRHLTHKKGRHHDYSRIRVSGRGDGKYRALLRRPIGT